MKTNLYIPPTITVGFQTRTDTFTGKLGYVIYTDHKGVLRKEKSWNSWRDHKIDSVTFDNTPQAGFTLNKGVQRDGYWGSGRSVVRVWSPQDFEFEISIDNLLGILMHADVSKRDITEPCVFAWNGTELILLPTNSVEYQQSVTHTAKQTNVVRAKDLKVGATYSVKANHEQRFVYLGKLDRYETENIERDYQTGGWRNYTRKITVGYKCVVKPKKYHVFISPAAEDHIEVRDSLAFLSECVSDEVHPDFLSLTDKYYSTAGSQQIIGLELDATAVPYGYWNYCTAKLNETDYVKIYASTEGGWSAPRFKATARSIVRWNKDTSQIEIHHVEEDASLISKLLGTSGQGQAVEDLLKQITDDLNHNPQTTDNHQHVKDVLTKHGCAQTLNFILADGKRARNNIYL